MKMNYRVSLVVLTMKVTFYVFLFDVAVILNVNVIWICYVWMKICHCAFDACLSLDHVFYRVHDLDLIEDAANLVWRQRRMIEVTAELIERLLKVHVVFPQGVVGVEYQVLGSGNCGHRRLIFGSR